MSAELWFRFLVPSLQSSQNFSWVLILSLVLCASLTLSQAFSANAFTTQRTYFISLFFSHLKLGFEIALTKSHLNWWEWEKIAQVPIREISWLSAASGEETTALSYKRKHQELFSPLFASKQEIVWAWFEEQSGESWGVNCAKPQRWWHWACISTAQRKMHRGGFSLIPTQGWNQQFSTLSVCTRREKSRKGVVPNSPPLAGIRKALSECAVSMVTVQQGSHCMDLLTAFCTAQEINTWTPASVDFTDFWAEDVQKKKKNPKPELSYSRFQFWS